MTFAFKVYWYAKKKKLEKCGEAMMTLVLNEFLEFLVMIMMVKMMMGCQQTSGSDMMLAGSQLKRGLGLLFRAGRTPILLLGVRKIITNR